MDLSTYIFSLNYGERLKEKQFIKDILKRYDKNKLTGSMAFINNNPYNFEFLYSLTFEGDTIEFENWLNCNYPDKLRKYNYFTSDIIEKTFSNGYNLTSLNTEQDVDKFITNDMEVTPRIFLFPDKNITNSMWKTEAPVTNFRVFLSHSSKDKNLVDHIFNELQHKDINVWYDKYEIKLGDSIIDKLSEGMENSNLGLIFLSENFIDSSTGWSKKELNYFIQRNIDSGKKNLIILNYGLEYKDIPPLIREYRYLDMKNPDAISELINTISAMID